MKKSTIISLSVICFFVCGIFTNVSGQEAANTDEQTSFGIRSAGINIGWYKPSMNYWNDTYFINNNWENKFESSFYYGAFFELNIIENLRARAGTFYWKETVGSGEIQIGGLMGKEELSVSLTSISIDAIYNLQFLAFEEFKPYGGLGFNFLFIQDKFTRQPNGLPKEEIKEQGQDYSGHIILGIERPVMDHFSAGLEFKYVLGKYVQEVRDVSGNIIKEDVSLSGLQIGINLFYTF